MIDYCTGPDCWVCRVLRHEHSHDAALKVPDDSGLRQAPLAGDAGP